MSRILKPHDQQSVEHLKRTLGNTVITAPSELLCVVAAAEVPRIIAEQAVETVEALLQDFIGWLKKLDIPVRSHSELITVGLFHKKTDYDAYLKQEGLEGLTGSLGATHPVRLISLILCDPMELKTTSPYEVIAHESIHLFSLKSGLCPGWDAWPRWLHEGLAMLGDHSAEKRLKRPSNLSKKNAPRPDSSSQLFATRNEDRARDWKKSASHLDISLFLRRDLTKNPLSNNDDYAASWAITSALSKWQNGSILQLLIEELANRFMQYESTQTIEVTAADWLKVEMGDKWPDFMKSARGLAES